MVKRDTKGKIIIYGSNILTPSITNFLKTITPKISPVTNKIPGLDMIADAATPLGAALFGALDIAGGLSSRIKNSKFTRLAKFTGACVYGGKTIADVFSIAGGEYASLADLVFDGSMFWQLGKDTVNNYGGNADLVDDTFGRKKE